MVAFGYEATGFGSDDVSLFEYTPKGELVWSAGRSPLRGHAVICVTENYIVIYVIPMVIDHQPIQEGGFTGHGNDSGRTHFAVVRRDGDGWTCAGSLDHAQCYTSWEHSKITAASIST